jgi:two-component system sensor histidine kinase TctE
LAPLDRLAEEAARRGADNLAPLDTGLAPREARGLIDAINRMMSRLSDSLDAQRRFTANAAHQLKTPLAGLRLQASLALKERDPDEQRAFLQDIEQSAARTAHIVEQLLLLARAEHATTVMQTTIDLAACARSAVARMLNAALDRGVDLGYDGPGQTTPIPGNPVLVEEMIANLIDNALRYAAATEITVQIERNPAGFLLSVNDNGRGIPKADRARLLERFNRGDTASAGGAGLGLAIVQEIAERHGARVSIAEPTGGRGCRIEIGFSASGDAVTA